MATMNTTKTSLPYTYNSILEFGNPQSWQAVAKDFEVGDPHASTAVPGFTGRSVIPQGAVYYTNGATTDPSAAEGVVMWHYDVTDRGHVGAVIHTGDINLNKMINASGITPGAEELRVLHERMGIRFHPHETYLTMVNGTATPASLQVDAPASSTDKKSK